MRTVGHWTVADSGLTSMASITSPGGLTVAVHGTPYTVAKALGDRGIFTWNGNFMHSTSLSG